MTFTVAVAFLANVAVAVAKSVAATITGSAGMVAEAEFRVERMRKRDIAEIFGISVSAVDKHLIRATAHLVKCLEDEA